MYYIGIDLGTSAVKLLLVDETGQIWHTVSKEYPLYYPHPGWAEQQPDDWWSACTSGIGELLQGFDRSQVAGIGVGGQMHGLVALDENDCPLRPAILWNDGRTAEEVRYLNEEVGCARLSQLTANIAFAGFTAPKLLWMQKHEPELFKKIARIMLPKDFINYRLTGVHCCDYSDASGTLLLDVQHKCWSQEMMDICGVSAQQLPALYESWKVIGTLRDDVAAMLGLDAGVRVVAGAGDNAAAAIGTGTIGDGGCNISLGTSGTIFISSTSFSTDPHNALHAFAHADGGYHLMGCMLSAAACNKWFCEDILKTDDYAAEQTAIDPERLGRGDVFFLPYLMGERSPINDVNARGTFTGMTLNTSRADMLQAVLEGVAFAIRDSLEVARSSGIHISRSSVCGGGSRSQFWRRILANVLALPLDSLEMEQGPGYGAAMLAMVGCGAYVSAAQAAEQLIHIAHTTPVEPELAARYEERYQKFRRLYPAMKPLFSQLV